MQMAGRPLPCGEARSTLQDAQRRGPDIVARAVTNALTLRTNFFTWALLGLLAGGIAKLIFPGKDPGGCLVTIAIGIVGALLGGLLGTTVFDWGEVTGFNLPSLGIAIAGSLVLLLVFRLLSRKR